VAKRWASPVEVPVKSMVVYTVPTRYIQMLSILSPHLRHKIAFVIDNLLESAVTALTVARAYED
jgi:hypothetical protein